MATLLSMSRSNVGARATYFSSVCGRARARVAGQRVRSQHASKRGAARHATQHRHASRCPEHPRRQRARRSSRPCGMPSPPSPPAPPLPTHLVQRQHKGRGDVLQLAHRRLRQLQVVRAPQLHAVLARQLWRPWHQQTCAHDISKRVRTTSANMCARRTRAQARVEAVASAVSQWAVVTHTLTLPCCLDLYQNTS